MPDGVDGVMSAGHWGTAAIVWAFTEDAQGSNQYGSRIDEKSPRLSITDFAQQKIRGLSTRDSVRKYRSAWEYAIGEGWAKPAVPGQAVTLPEQPFKTEGGVHVGNSSGESEWYTPEPFIRAARVLPDEETGRLREAWQEKRGSVCDGACAH